MKKAWRGEDLVGHYEMSYKIDGVNVTVKAGTPLSKAGKLFANVALFLEQGGWLDDGEYEFYRKDWSESVSLLKNSSRADEIKQSDFYSLYPELDSRLKIGAVVDPTGEYIKNRLQEAVAQGYEGLVLRAVGKDLIVKVKTSYSHDLCCTDFLEGAGKYNKGTLGVLVFQIGNKPVYVRSGITKADSITWFKDPSLILDTIFEIGYTSLTPSGMLRHPYIIRQRLDKNDESLV